MKISKDRIGQYNKTENSMAYKYKGKKFRDCPKEIMFKN